MIISMIITDNKASFVSTREVIQFQIYVESGSKSGEVLSLPCINKGLDEVGDKLWTSLAEGVEQLINIYRY